MAKVSRARMRRLIHIPIVHTQADMGTLRKSVRRVVVGKLGEEAWTRNIQAIQRFWEGVSDDVLGWKLPYQRVRLYQDGLPVCGREVDIVKHLVQAGSRNHQLLMGLMEKGATLMGTESPKLLLQEYELIQQMLAAGDPEAAARIEAQQKELSLRLLERRNRYIAGQINRTLHAGETGILFLGMLHSLEGLLAEDIQVSFPIGRPVPQAGAADSPKG